MYNHLLVTLLRGKWLFAMLAILLVMSLAYGTKYISFATDYEVWFSEDNPQLKDFLRLQKIYNKSDNVIFLIAPKNGKIFNRKVLSDIEWLTKQAWQLPYSTRVDSITNFQYSSAAADTIKVRNLITNAKQLSEQEIESIKQIALSEPLLKNRLVSANAAVSAINVTINLPKNQAQGSPTVTLAARKLVHQLKQLNPELDVYLTGLVVMDNAFMEASQQDMQTLTLLMFALVLTGLIFFLRSLFATISILILSLLTMISTMGISGWLGFKLTPVSASAPTIIMTIVVASVVHILVSLLHELAQQTPKQQALYNSLQRNLGPIFLASITTIIGFLSMLFSDIPPFHHLAYMVSGGVLVAFILYILLLPALLTIMPIKAKNNLEKTSHFSARLSQFIITKHKQILNYSILFSILLLMFIPVNKVNERIWEYFDNTVKFRTDTDYAAQHLTGPYYLEYSLRHPESGGVSQPDFLNKIAKFKTWLEQQDQVIHVNSITDVLKRLNKNMHSDDNNWYKLAQEKSLNAQYLLSYEMSLPYGLDLNDQLNLNKSATRLIVSLKNLSNNEMIQFHNHATSWLQQNAATISVTTSSPMYMFSHLSKRTVSQMSVGIATALILVSLILTLSLRSLRLGIISLVPNLLPPAIALGIWGIFVAEVSFALAVGAAMTIGIIVDDTVHFLSKYQRARQQEKLSAEEAIRYAYTHVGQALLITTVVLVAGFSVLMLSSFKLNFDLGAITAITISLALILDFLLLPALLIRFDRSNKLTNNTNNKQTNDIAIVR